MSILQDQKKFQEQSLKENILTTKKPFTRKRIKLDNARNFADTDTGNNYNSAFRAFWVVDAANNDFKVNMYVNPDTASGDPLPLRPNMNFDFEQIIDGARFEFEAQAGGWIDILFFSVGFGQLGNVELSSTGSVSVSDGSSFENGKLTVPNAAASLLVPANEKRGVYTIINESAYDVYFGTEANLNHADWKTLCPKIGASGGVFTWKNKSGLYLRADHSASVDVKFISEEA